jgi:peptide/nickel transport system substrate-binding protein
LARRALIDITLEEEVLKMRSTTTPWRSWRSWQLVLVVLGVAVVAAALAVSSVSARPRAAAKSSSATIPLLRVGVPFATGIPTLNRFNTNSQSVVDDLGLETLFRISPDGSLQPWLATSMSQPSPTKYVYTLRPGVTFWDGHPLTAADVAYSLNYLRGAGSWAAHSFTSVKSITAKGKGTVVVTLAHPDASFKWVMASSSAIVFEKAFAVAHKSTLGLPGTLIVGTGPFKFVSLDATTNVVKLAANNSYWGGKPNVRAITVQAFQTPEALGLAFRTGAVDVALELQDVQSFRAASGAPIVNAAGCSLAWFYMPTQTAPWNDVHVRRAVAYALNKTAITEAAGGGPIASTLIAPGQLGTLGTSAQVATLLKPINAYSTSLAKAREEMALSAYPHGFSGTFPTLNAPSFTNVAQVIATELAPLGIKLSVTTETYSQYSAQIAGPRTQMPLGYIYAPCQTPDPSFWPGFILGSANAAPGAYNFSDYTPAGVDNLISSGLTTQDPAKRLAIYGQLLKDLANDVPLIPLYNLPVSMAISSKFSWPTFNQFADERPWALEIKAK